jgi:outer membrane protein TolC
MQALLPPPPADAAAALQQTLADVDRLVDASQHLLAREAGGLVPIEVGVEEAMLTALTLRYDLMNQRETLADSWRDIKFAGDDLKSVLNLRASERLRTRRDTNRPFDFTFDDSDTRLTLTFDAPLNRRAQRNRFRRSLIDYNAGLRSLMEREDAVKFDVRDSLRRLALDQEQYRIDVASAALAYERRISTRLQLRLGIQNVRVIDVLDAQQAYTRSLSRLASSHIQYILDRIGLFLDLELLEVDDAGFWQQLYDDQHQPSTNLHVPEYALPVYGQLPHGTWPSHQIKRMLHVPPGQTTIYRPDGEGGDLAEEIAAPLPDVLPPPPDEAAEAPAEAED